MKDHCTANEDAAGDFAAAEAYWPTRRELADLAGFVDEEVSRPIERDAEWDAALDDSIRAYVAMRERRAG